MKIFGIVVALVIAGAAGFGARDVMSSPPPAPATEEVSSILFPFETDVPGVKPSIVIKPSVHKTDGRTYHITQLIARGSISLDLDPMVARYRKEEVKERLGSKGIAVAKSLLSIPGVTDVTMRPYSIEIEKGDAFTWDEIETTALAVIKSIHDGKDVEVRRDDFLANNGIYRKHRYDGGGHNFGLYGRKKRDDNTIVIAPPSGSNEAPASASDSEKKPETSL